MGSPNLHPHRTGKLKTLAASTVTYMKQEHQGKGPAIYAIYLLDLSLSTYFGIKQKYKTEIWKVAFQWINRAQSPEHH